MPNTTIQQVFHGINGDILVIVIGQQIAIRGSLLSHHVLTGSQTADNHGAIRACHHSGGVGTINGLDAEAGPSQRSTCGIIYQFND